MKKITDLKANEGILCKTEEECNKILDLMHESWLKWCDNTTYKENRIMDWLDDWWITYCPYLFEWTHSCTSNPIIKKYPASDFYTDKPTKLTYTKQYIRNDWLVFTADKIGEKTLKEIKKEIDTHKQEAKRLQGLLQSHKNMEF